ncbi:MAG: hypothetical protein PVI30_25875 [Myxococcales bacterium]|jgi:hypothetical protein
MRPCIGFAALLTLLGCDSDGYLGSHAPQGHASEGARQDAGPAGGQTTRAGDLVSGLAEDAKRSDAMQPAVDAGAASSSETGGESGTPTEAAPVEAAPMDEVPVDEPPDAAVTIEEPVHDAGMAPDAAVPAACTVETDNPCLSCEVEACCEQRHLCLEGEVCACHRECDAGPDLCEQECGPRPDAFDLLRACVETECAEVCP